MLYAEAASVAVSFDTQVRTSTNAATSTALTAANTGIPTGRRVFRPTGASGTIVASGLFPFRDGYTFYSGGCAGADPESLAPGYFSSHPGFVEVEGGGSEAIAVREPAINLQVTRGSTILTATPFRDAHVVITPEQTGCTEKFTVQGGLTTSGALPEPGFPFGRYTVCVDDRRVVSQSSNRRFAQATGVLSSNPAGLPFAADGTPQLKLWINTLNLVRGQCA